MRNIIIAAFLVLTAYRSWAQPLMNKDSLLKLLPAAKEDTNKVRLLIAIADVYHREDLKVAKKYYQLADALSRKLDYKVGIFLQYNGWLDALYQQGYFDSSLQVCLETIAWCRKIDHPRYLAYTLYNAAMAYSQLGQYENATSAVEESRAVFERIGIRTEEGSLSLLQQVMAADMHQYRKAVTYGKKAAAFLETVNDPERLCYSYNNLGLDYTLLQSYDSARYYSKKAYEIAVVHNITIVKMTYPMNMGFIHLREQNLDSLRYYGYEIVNLARQYQAHSFEMLGSWGLFYYYLSKKEYGKAKEFADSATHLIDQYNMRQHKLKLYPTLANYYFAVQDTKLGNYYAQEAEFLQDSILNESIARTTIDIEKKYETERKDSQIRLQQSELEQKSLINYCLVGGAVLLLIISLLTYRNYRSRQKLQQAKIDDLEKEKQLNATEAVLKGEEQERARLARELHDGLGGMLSGIKHSLVMAKESLGVPADKAQAFDRNIDMLDSSIREMRRVAHNMMPEMLLKYGLNTALKEFCDEITRSGVLHIAYQPMGMDRLNIDQTTALAVYRIVQELVHNAIKHASANSVLVQVHAAEQDKLLSITVEDDGRGFVPNTLNNAAGIGWLNIQNRIDFLKGRVDLSAAPGKGTSVLVEVSI